jgi:hypothetical protein
MTVGKKLSYAGRRIFFVTRKTTLDKYKNNNENKRCTMSIHTPPLTPGDTMHHPLPKLLFAFAMLAAQAGLVHADVMTGSHVTFETRGWTPVSAVGDTFTLSNPTYAQDGAISSFLDRSTFQFTAQEGYYMTGNFHVVMDISYAIPEPVVSRSLFISAGYDVLYPPCEQCGPFDSAQVDYANGYANGQEAEGVLHLDYGNTNGAGAYERLFLASLLYASFQELYGEFRVDSYAITVETRPLASAVPELPPVAMLGAGLALLGYSARRRRPGRACATRR